MLCDRLWTVHFAVAVGCSLLLLPGTAGAGVLNFLERDSNARNRVFAGSGPAVDQSNESDSTSSLTGSFGFADSAAVSVSPGTGSATATGDITFTDSVDYNGSTSITINAAAVANGVTQWGSGTGNATSRRESETFVRFAVVGTDAQYSLTGNYTPPADGGTISFQLFRPFTTNKRFDIDTAGPLNETGTIPAGQTWALRVRVNDTDNANAGKPLDADSYSYDFSFNVTSLPGLFVTGDLNGDGALTNGDIAAFVQALTDPASYASDYPDLDPDARGDFTGDSTLTNGDIAGFVSALTGSGTTALTAVPEPASAVLLGVGVLLVRRRRAA